MKEARLLNKISYSTPILFRQLLFSRFSFVICLTLITVLTAVTASARPLKVRVNRWLELRRLSGTVNFLQSGQWRQAQVGQRLESVGDGLRTGPGSLARLAVDTQVGFVSVSQNTTLSITELYTTPRGGKVTQLEVSRGGQARIFVRQFTNPDSRLEIRTPAGVNGVRGTDFGMTTQPSGRSSLATEEGSVVSGAQGLSVPVDAGFQNFTIPGEPPSEPVPLTDDPGLNLFRIERQSREGISIVVLEGSTDPVNLLVVEDETQEVDPEGNFALELPLREDRRIEMTVTTPLGKMQPYEVVP